MPEDQVQAIITDIERELEEAKKASQDAAAGGAPMSSSD